MVKNAWLRATNRAVAYHRTMNVTISDWAIVVATVVGPLAAVLISLWIEQRRAKRATRQGLVHTFLNAISWMQRTFPMARPD